MCRVQEGVVSRSFPAVSFGTGPGVAADGRRYVQACLADLRASPDLVEIAVLLASELLTNAALHGSAPITVQVQVRGDRIRVSVADASPAPPVLRDGNDYGGWGLHLLERAAAAWGHHEEEDGKCVWFELAAE